MPSLENLETNNTHNNQYNRNHQKTLYAIFKATRKRSGRVTSDEVADLTGVSRQAFYNHYPDIRSAEYQGVGEMLDDFEAQYDTQGKKYAQIIPDNNRRVFYMLMVYMHRMNKFFNIVCKEVRHHGIIYRMVRKAFRRLEFNWLPAGTAAPSMKSERVGMCVWMLVAVIGRWGRETHCDINKADHYLDRIMRILRATETNALP